jgi:hypothetical protein
MNNKKKRILLLIMIHKILVIQIIKSYYEAGRPKIGEIIRKKSGSDCDGINI